MNNIRSIITALFAISFVLLFAESARAQTPATSSSLTTAQNQRLDKKTQAQSQRLETLRTKALAEIDRRITSLNELIQRMNLAKRLTINEKSLLSTSLHTEITNLSSLKTKIQADADLETLRIDSKSVVTSHRIYALFLPKIHILITSDVLLTLSDQLTELATKLSERITEAQTAGKNVTTLQTTLGTLQSKIESGKKLAQDAKDTVFPLSPELESYKTTLQTARGMIKNSRKEFVQARQDAKSIANSLRLLTKESSSSSASSTPTIP